MRSVGAFATRWPSHVVSRHARLCQNASMNDDFRSSGIGVEVVGCPSGPVVTDALVERARGHPPGPCALRAGEHRADVVQGLARAAEPAAAQIGEVVGVTDDRRAAVFGVGAVRGRAAVHLVERAFAEDRHDVHVGRRAEPFVEVEVRVAAARHVEALVERAVLLEQLAGHEDAVALPQPVEPVAVADEVPDVEEPVAVDRPFDLAEQLVFVALVVAAQHRVGLLAGPDVPLLGDDDRGLVGGEAGHAVAQHARCEHVRAVDHEHDRAAGRDLDAAVERVDRSRCRVGAEVEVPELGTEAAHVLLAELLLGRGTVLDDDDFVVEAVDAALIRRA